MYSLSKEKIFKLLDELEYDKENDCFTNDIIEITVRFVYSVDIRGARCDEWVFEFDSKKEIKKFINEFGYGLSCHYDDCCRIVHFYDEYLSWKINPNKVLCAYISCVRIGKYPHFNSASVLV